MLFDDEEDDDDLDMHSSHKNNAEIVIHDTATNDNETNDPRKGPSKEIENIEQQKDHCVPRG